MSLRNLSKNHHRCDRQIYCGQHTPTLVGKQSREFALFQRPTPDSPFIGTRRATACKQELRTRKSSQRGHQHKTNVINTSEISVGKTKECFCNILYTRDQVGIIRAERVQLAEWCKIHKVYIYSHSTLLLLFTNIFIHIQQLNLYSRNILIHI